MKSTVLRLERLLESYLRDQYGVKLLGCRPEFSFYVSLSTGPGGPKSLLLPEIVT